MNNIKIVRGFDSNKSPYAKTVQQLFQGIDSFIANSSHPVDVAQVSPSKICTERGSEH